MIISASMTFILAFPVLFAGSWLNKKIPFLNKYHIPEAISGGLVFSMLLIVVELILKTDIDFNDDLKNLLLLWFFSTIGLSSSIGKLLSGGRTMLFLLLIAAVYLFIQNFVGVGIALAFGFNPVAGLVGGSISLTGGHGTALAWSTVFEEEYGLVSSHVFGAVAATFGLVLGGLAGGPVGTYLIKKHKLSGAHEDVQTVGLDDGYRDEKSIDYNSLLFSLFLVAVTAAAGSWLSGFGKGTGLNIPPFVYCLIVGIVLTNMVPGFIKRIDWPSETASMAVISDITLGLFLSMAMMGLDIRAMKGSAIPILILMAVQLLVIVLFSVYIVFPAMGKTYDAAVITAGYLGLGLGATPTALANMTALTHHFGVSPRSFIIIPLMGAFFIDLINSFVIEFFLRFIT